MKERMPEPIRQAIKAVIVEAGARSEKPGETLVRTDAVIAKLDEFGYFPARLTYREKYRAVAPYLFDDEGEAEQPPPGLQLLADAVISNRKAFNLEEVVDEIMSIHDESDKPAA